MKPRTKPHHLSRPEAIAEAIVRQHLLNRPGAYGPGHGDWWKPSADCSCTACVEYRRAFRTLRTGR